MIWKSNRTGTEELGHSYRTLEVCWFSIVQVGLMMGRGLRNFQSVIESSIEGYRQRMSSHWLVARPSAARW